MQEDTLSYAEFLAQDAASPVPKMSKQRKEMLDLRAQLGKASKKVFELEEELRFIRGENSSVPDEREYEFKRLCDIINALKASFATEQSLHNEMKSVNWGLKRHVKELEKRLNNESNSTNVTG